MKEALLIDKEIVALMRRLYGTDDQRTLEAETSLAVSLRRQGGEVNLKSALQTLTRVHELKIELLGRDEVSTLDTASYLAETYKDLGCVAEATKRRREVLAGRRRTLGENHAQTLHSYALYAGTLCLQRNFGEAREIYDQVRPVAMRVLGPDHRTTLCWDVLRRKYLER